MQIIPIASGKGGVGKSLLAANLAVTLGKAGKDVILADLDLGASNLHLALGQQAPKTGLGTFLSGASQFEDIIMPSGYKNVRFIAGDSEIPGLTALPLSQKNMLIKKFQRMQTDYLIIDLGAGTHLTILDMFLLSPQGILVTAPTVTATLNGYLFLKNVLFRLMYNSFKKNSKAYKYLEQLKSDAASLQRLYIPKLTEAIIREDPESAKVFVKRIQKFRPRLVMNMIEDPKDAERAAKIRRSCSEYLGLNLDYLGVVYRDPLQDIALSSRLPITVYKPQSILSQSIYRIADKIMQSEDLNFDDEGLPIDSFDLVESEAVEDYEAKMSYVEDLIGSGALTAAELADTIKAQQYELTQLRKENLLLKSKIVKAHSQGFQV
ncbi:P-loop NTPase [Treponema lecithinolyticum]|jgi:ATP-binding protein|uniref:P-loop NTPase n=1 Tax=Treponema lecithinolyticum TaxID=53418 RepID=UPI0028ED2703|nr:P-loop NTPase [Treponema lecithinolyticum]